MPREIWNDKYLKRNSFRLTCKRLLVCIRGNNILSNLKSKKAFIKGKLNVQGHKVVVHKLQEKLPTATQSDTNTPGASLIFFLKFWFAAADFPFLFACFCSKCYQSNISSTFGKNCMKAAMNFLGVASGGYTKKFNKHWGNYLAVAQQVRNIPKFNGV